MTAPAAAPAQPKPRRREWLWELLFGVELDRPLICPSCHWRHHRARLGALRRLVAGLDVRCTWCSFPIVRPERKP